MTQRIICMIYHSIENFISSIIFSTQMHCGIQLITHKRGNESFRVCFFLFASLFRSLSLYFWILLYHIKSISFGIFSKKISVSTDSKTRLRKQECVTHRRFAITMNLQWHYKIETDSVAFKRLSGTPFVMVSSMAFLCCCCCCCGCFCTMILPNSYFLNFFFSTQKILLLDLLLGKCLCCPYGKCALST